MNDKANPTTQTQTNPASPGTTPAAATPIDEAITENVALLFSPSAPLASADPEKKEDKRAVWACVPDSFSYEKPTVLIYFHGFNNYVTVSVKQPSGVHRSPPFGWINAFRNDNRRGNVGGTSASGPKYGLDKPFQKHSPLVLVPEVGVADSTSEATVDATRATFDSFDWTAFKAAKAAFDKAKKDHVVPLPPEPHAPPDVPPWAEDGTGKMGTTSGLGDLIDNCIIRLKALPKPSRSSNYLDPAKALDQTKLKRIFLSGHSGGGLPLSDTAKSDLALGGAVPIDLWSLDSTYGTGTTAYPNFCKTLDGLGKLGNGASLSRFVGIVIKNTGTDTNPKSNNRMTDIIKDINKLGLKAGKVTEIDYNHSHAATELPPLETALSTKPMVVIRITGGVVHDEIPKVFIPILVRTAAGV